MPESLKTTKLRNELWYPNTTPDDYSDNQAGYKERYAMGKDSQQFTMLGQLVDGLFQQQRWMPAGNKIRIVLRRSPSVFALDNRIDANDDQVKLDYKIEIDSATLLVQRKPVSQTVVDMTRRGLELDQTIKFNLNEPVVKSFSVPSGLSQYTTEAILIGRVPKIIVLGLTTSEAFAGKLTKSPMNFGHQNLKDVSVIWHTDTMESRSIPLNFKTSTNTASDDFLEGVQSLQKTVANEFLWNGISRDNYTAGKETIINVIYS